MPSLQDKSGEEDDYVASHMTYATQQLDQTIHEYNTHSEIYNYITPPMFHLTIYFHFDHDPVSNKEILLLNAVNALFEYYVHATIIYNMTTYKLIKQFPENFILPTASKWLNYLESCTTPSVNYESYIDDWFVNEIRSFNQNNEVVVCRFIDQVSKDEFYDLYCRVVMSVCEYCVTLLNEHSIWISLDGSSRPVRTNAFVIFFKVYL